MQLKNSTPEHFYNQLRKHRKYLPEWSKLTLTEKKRIASKLQSMEYLLGDIYRAHTPNPDRHYLFRIGDSRFNLCSEIPLVSSRKPALKMR